MTPIRGLRKSLTAIKRLVMQIAKDSAYDVNNASTRPAYLRIAGCEKHIRDCRKIARAGAGAKKYALLIGDAEIIKTVISIRAMSRQVVAECNDTIPNNDYDAREWAGQEPLDDCQRAITRARRLIRELLREIVQ